MKALSAKPTMAYAIIHLGKNIENRQTLKNFRGELAIHSSSTLTRIRYEEDVEYIHSIRPRAKVPLYEDIPKGAIIGVVSVIDCVEESNSPWFEGRYGFVLRNIRALRKPVACNGALNFWEVPKDVEKKIKRML